ncbi:hypothetical protein Moror_6812 [Moniliophthora roreri MCA 2997]|uniref:Xylanolytic transcriptional activator regulatory domain-containing protein n=1 Tax=Moniliophthora roreri (strain MCA 2997) TaxID=1381753 RepID=V2XS64_MONRO|nr:hypothetical protein Moror_6812 [Moniliophthora roreri MCA 2997]
MNSNLRNVDEHTLGNGATTPGDHCSNCLAFNAVCTYSEQTKVKRRGAKNPYVERLEKRVKSMEEIIRKFSPNFNFGELSIQRHASKLSAIGANSFKDTIHPLSSSVLSASQPQATSLSPVSINHLEEDDFSYIDITEKMKKISLNSELADSFFGPASSFKLLHTAHGTKSQYIGKESFDTLYYKRPKIWEQRPWELSAISFDKTTYVFPEDDLLHTLVSLYFSQVNCYLPLIHAPTFKRLVLSGVHHTNHKFGGLLLAMCALASRYSDDPRVFENPKILTSAGWKYFKQVKTLSGVIIDAPSLYDLQTFCLVTLYLYGSSFPEASWALVGVAIRYAEGLGYHRRKPDSVKLTPEIEQQKRVFWVLVTMDRMTSNFTGRPCAICEEDYDQQLPVDCDDEFWPGENNGDPNLAFEQPANKPSFISCFICQIKLYEILGFALRTLFPTKRTKTILGLVGVNWEQKIVSALDSSLNDWINNIPDHLRWDPNRENALFFNQSAYLHSIYYDVQIQTHRPFIQKPSTFTFLSLAICTNAARSCINILYRHSQSERGSFDFPHILHAAFAACAVLLTNIWSGKRTGIKFDQQRELSDVAKIMSVLGKLEKRWVGAGKFMDIMCELARGIDGTDSNPCDMNHPKSPILDGNPPPVEQSSRDSSSSYSRSAILPSESDSSATFEQPVSTDFAPSIPFSSEELGTRPFGLDLPGLGGMPTGSVLSIDDVNGIFPDGTMSNSSLGADNIYPDANDSDMAWNTLGDQSLAAMWTTAPTGFSVDEWDQYIEHINSVNPP